MTTETDETTSRARVPRKAIAATGGVAALVALLLYMEGAFNTHKVSPGVVPLPAAGAPTAAAVRVESREVDEWVDWPATVTSRLVANLAPKMMARVREVRVNAGQAVKQGDVIAVLDDRDVRARSQQASAALRAAEAQAAQAESELRRTQTLFQKQAATQQDLDAADTRAKSARAQVAQGRDMVEEAQVVLGETTLRAPFDGVVGARFADPGDMGVPGKPIAIVHDPGSLRLEANLSESCSGPLALGMSVAVRLGTPPVELNARIEEIAPVADPQSRTRLVKAALPAQAGLRPGMFATLRFACGTHRALLVPAKAVRRAGQLESVRVAGDGEARLRNVRTGKAYGEQVEILSGVQPGEMVLVED
jgi:RND family efflux transporter MFP subunit